MGQSTATVVFKLRRRRRRIALRCEFLEIRNPILDLPYHSFLNPQKPKALAHTSL